MGIISAGGLAEMRNTSVNGWRRLFEAGINIFVVLFTGPAHMQQFGKFTEQVLQYLN